MARPVTLCTLQWGDLPLDVICEKAKSFGFDGVELGLPSHLDVRQTDPEYYRNIKVTLDKYGLQLFCISNHLVGQAICDNIDQRHKSVLPDYIWGDGDPDGVHLRAVENMIQAAHAARMLGVDTVVGFTGSSIWQWLYSFPPVTDEMVNEGYADFARRFIPILDEYQKLGVRFALEVYIIHSLIPQMARIVIKTESRMIIDRFKSLTGRISIERDLGRMHFESETDT